MILDSNGRPVQSGNPQSKWVPSASRYNGTLPYEPTRLDDFDKLVPMQDWRTVVSVSKRLFVRTGIVKGASLQRATYAVGNHWLPTFKGRDQKWGSFVRELLIEEWYGNCDIRGRMFDWRTLLKVDSLSIDREGDFGILLLDTEYPLMQRVSAHRIGQRTDHDIVKKGTYSGAKITNGVILNKSGTPIAYRLLGSTEKEDVDVEAKNFVHVFDPNWHDQQRGLPVFVHALNDLRSGIYSQNWEMLAQMIVSAIGLIEYNEYGEADSGNPTTVFGDDVDSRGVPTGTQSPTYEHLYGGMLRYFRANSGGKLEQLKHERPGDMWESFQDRIIRSALAGIPWPYSFTWKTSDLNSVTQRTEILKAQNAVRERQQLMKKYNKAIIGWAVSKFVKLGRIPPNDEWYKWEFTTPPKLGIDPGKDAKATESEFALGTINMDQIVGERTGESLETHWRNRAHQVVLKQRIAEEVTAEYGGKYPVTPDDLGKTPVSGGSPPVESDQPQKKPEDDDEPNDDEDNEDDDSKDDEDA